MPKFVLKFTGVSSVVGVRKTIIGGIGIGAEVTSALCGHGRRQTVVRKVSGK